MNKDIKYILENEYLGFNPKDLDDGRPKQRLSTQDVKNSIYRYKPTTLGELKICIKTLIADGEYDLNCIDVSEITTLSHLFDQAITQNINLTPDEQAKLDVTYWDVHNVKNFNAAFAGCKAFNCDLSHWDVSSCTKFRRMFADCWSFNSDLSHWDVSSGLEFTSMFENCTDFTCDLSKWNVSSGTNFDHMFKNCEQFNCDLSDWKVFNGETFEGMFEGVPDIDFDITKWRFCTQAMHILSLIEGNKMSRYQLVQHFALPTEEE